MIKLAHTEITPVRVFRRHSGRIDAVSFLLKDGTFLRVLAEVEDDPDGDESYTIALKLNPSDFEGHHREYFRSKLAAAQYKISEIVGPEDADGRKNFLVGVQLSFEKSPPFVVGAGNLPYTLAVFGIGEHSDDGQFAYDLADCMFADS